MVFRCLPPRSARLLKSSRLRWLLRVKRREALNLLLLRRFVDVQHLNRLFGFLGELVDAHDHLLALLDFALEFVAGLRDLGLRKAALDGGIMPPISSICRMYS